MTYTRHYPYQILENHYWTKQIAKVQPLDGQMFASMTCKKADSNLFLVSCQNKAHVALGSFHNKQHNRYMRSLYLSDVYKYKQKKTMIKIERLYTLDRNT